MSAHQERLEKDPLYRKQHEMQKYLVDCTLAECLEILAFLTGCAITQAPEAQREQGMAGFLMALKKSVQLWDRYGVNSEQRERALH